LGARAGAMELSAPGALRDLRALVIADHSLELAQQLVLGRVTPIGLLGEDHLHARPRKLLQQQHLIGITTRKPIRRMAEQHLKRAVVRTVAQPLECRSV
jgi:hypothetical protein